MKTRRLPSNQKQALTLLEMTIVIMVLLALVKLGLSATTMMDKWKLGRAASEDLRSVYSAQRMYLADNPLTPVASLVDAMLIPYLPNRGVVAPATLVAAFQPIKAITGANLGFRITQSPPVLVQGAVVYDPSGSATDSLWDVGQ
jgi:type II secretory pathway pseudopilin PulG